MTPPSGVRRVYDPDTLQLMTSAFERACCFLPVQFRDNDRVRTRVASHIIRRINDGENDPVRLADSAVLSVIR
jgi:hypothetical protein